MNKEQEQKHHKLLDAVNKELKRQWTEVGHEPGDNHVKDEIWNNIKVRSFEKSTSHALLKLKWYLAAASLIGLVFVWSLLNYAPTYSEMDGDELIKVVAHQNRIYTLPDSSKVWMEPGSTISFHKQFTNNRKVWLTGNSLFDVEHHPQSTFRVYISQSFIEVKGTSFLVKQSDEGCSDVLLFNGKIAFNATATGQEILLKPMQRLTYDPRGDQSPHVEDFGNVTWADGKYTFKGISLESMIDIVNRMYDKDIILQGKHQNGAAFSGSLRFDESLEDVLYKICFTLDLKQKTENGRIVIY